MPDSDAPIELHDRLNVTSCNFGFGTHSAVSRWSKFVSCQGCFCRDGEALRPVEVDLGCAKTLKGGLRRGIAFPL